MDLHEIWWCAVKNDLLVDRDSFMAEAKTWTVTPVHVGGELAAIVLTKGSEIHLIKTGKHQFTRALIRSVLRIGMTTRVPSDKAASRAFVRRMGFNFIGADEYDHHYRLERLPHA